MRYDIIYSDPPWEQKRGKGNLKVRPKTAGKELPYPTLSISEIKAIHKDFFNLVAEKHNIFMWTIDKYLFEAEQMMKDLGYVLHARIIWDKGKGPVPAFTIRFQHEYLLWFYKKGNILKPIDSMRGKYSTVLRENSTKHSKKPECAYEMIENMFPKAKKLELFARNKRPGWDSWGNEVEDEF